MGNLNKYTNLHRLIQGVEKEDLLPEQSEDATVCFAVGRVLCTVGSLLEEMSYNIDETIGGPDSNTPAAIMHAEAYGAVEKVAGLAASIVDAVNFSVVPVTDHAPIGHLKEAMDEAADYLSDRSHWHPNTRTPTQV